MDDKSNICYTVGTVDTQPLIRFAENTSITTTATNKCVCVYVCVVFRLNEAEQSRVICIYYADHAKHTIGYPNANRSVSYGTTNTRTTMKQWCMFSACSGYCDLSIYVIHNGSTGQISLVFMQIIQVVCILHRLHEWKLHLILRYALIVHICATNRLYIWVRRGQCNIGSHWMFLPTIAIVFDWEGGSAATI